MTEREAVEELKGILEEATEEENSVCYVTDCDKEPLEMAIQALEKQMPTAPLNRGGIPEMAYCPDCGEVVTKSANPVCCKWCGKMLDWNN